MSLSDGATRRRWPNLLARAPARGQLVKPGPLRGPARYVAVSQSRISQNKRPRAMRRSFFTRRRSRVGRAAPGLVVGVEGDLCCLISTHEACAPTRSSRRVRVAPNHDQRMLDLHKTVLPPRFPRRSPRGATGRRCRPHQTTAPRARAPPSFGARQPRPAGRRRAAVERWDQATRVRLSRAMARPPARTRAPEIKIAVAGA